MASRKRMLKRDIEPITEARELKPGDHLVKKIFKDFSFVYHHGVFLGGGRGVLHLVDSQEGTTNDIILLSQGAIMLDDINTFTNRWSTELFRVVYEEGERRRSLDEILEKANDLLDGTETWGDYNLIKNNCEHFIYYLTTGQKVSHQVEYAEKVAWVSLAVGLGALVLGAAFIWSRDKDTDKDDRDKRPYQYM